MKKTWSMVAPPEPDASVTRVVDRDDSVWTRTDRGWSNESVGAPWEWLDLVVTYGPVTAEVPDPIVVTEAMAQAGNGTVITLPENYTGADVFRLQMIAALRAGGYKVAES